ncbi:MAG TPA: META domain-containing protein [Propionicimonas sp.]|jgi:heat shock protein HslJ|uniref:META domain-containing protein n=1 Tax=Propionicimonas sp. TaxID=1955623 RepID=UPI002F4259CB
MNDDFEDRVRLAIHHDGPEIAPDTDAAIREGRRVVRERRVGWGIAACTVVAGAALLLPGVVQRGVPAVPARPGATISAWPAPAITLAGTEWNAVALEGAALRPGTSITLRFGEGWVDGFGGCNHFGYTTVDGKIDAGSYREDGDRLAIAPVATTTMGCANGVGDQEGRFLQALPRVERFAISGGGLELFGPDGTELVELEASASILERSGWTVTAIKGVAPGMRARQPNLVFRSGTLTGYDGCNAVNGTVAGTVDDLKVSVRGGTYRLCDGELVRTQQSEFAAALESATRAVVQGDRLTLIDTSATPLLEAIADPALLLATEGISWRLDNKDGDWGAGTGSGITLRVGTEALSGESGCGRYVASYKHRADDWTITDVSRIDPIPCPSTLGGYAERFLGLLKDVTTVQVAQNQLRLITPEATLTFSR